MSELQHTIRDYQLSDTAGILNVVAASAEVDQLDPHSTLENLPNLPELLESLTDHDGGPKPDVFVVTDKQNGDIVGYGKISWWEEEDGTMVYRHQGRIHPDYRRKGLGERLLAKLQERVHQLANSHTGNNKRVHATNVSNSEEGTRKLVENNKYQNVFSQVEMEFTDFSRLEDIDQPEGVEFREIKTDEDKRRVYAANKKIYEGRFGNTKPSEEDYQEYLEDHPDMSLWKVLWSGDEVVGFVISKPPRGNHAAVSEVGTVAEFRGRHIAKYLMTESMRELQKRGGDIVRLHTNAEGQMGGRQLYESLGFSSLKEHHFYRRPF